MVAEHHEARRPSLWLLGRFAKEPAIERVAPLLQAFEGVFYTRHLFSTLDSETFILYITSEAIEK